MSKGAPQDHCESCVHMHGSERANEVSCDCTSDPNDEKRKSVTVHTENLHAGCLVACSPVVPKVGRFARGPPLPALKDGLSEGGFAWWAGLMAYS